MKFPKTHLNLSLQSILTISLIPLIMAPPSVANIATPQEVSARVGPPLPGTRHITMYTDKKHAGDTIIKFISVPDAYELMDIKHADHAGQFWTFENGDTWLVLNEKRLFLTPDYGDGEIDPDIGSADDWPIMSPEELKEALKGVRPYEESQARLMAAEARHKAHTAEPGNNLEERQSCSTIRCRYSDDCYPLSTSTLDCYRCQRNRHCTVRRLLPNYVGHPSPW